MGAILGRPEVELTRMMEIALHLEGSQNVPPVSMAQSIFSLAAANFVMGRRSEVMLIHLFTSVLFFFFPPLFFSDPTLILTMIDFFFFFLKKKSFGMKLSACWSFERR
jgi:hypothetical protein